MADYYQILGVARDASQDEIQKAYLNLARKYHPDMNPDDPEGAKKKFQELQTAFDVLKDPKKREQYNLLGENYQQYGGAGFNPNMGGGNFHWTSAGGGEGINLNDIFGMFGGGQGGGNPFGAGAGNPFGSGGNPFSGFAGRTTGRRRRTGPVRGDDVTSSIEVPFRIAVQGGSLPLTIQNPSGKMESIDVKIPAGIESGKKIRLRGMGTPGSQGGKAGDLLLEVHVKEHPWFTRKENNLYVRVPITLKEAALGGKIDVPTPEGEITVTVPPGTTTGTKLRLKGHGIKGKTSGDLFISFEVQLPKSWSPGDQELLKKLDASPATPVRSGLYF
ncbi:MAG: DnaJ domain-containing protein [Thermoguttaceae bacterium]|nr:DnaJ domain-containing protein [Thermoguttaceae bacterium]